MPILALRNVVKRYGAHTVLHDVSLDVEPGSFDAAISRLGLMYLPDKLGSLESARAALRPGGRYAAIVFAEPDRNGFFSAPIGKLSSALRRFSGVPYVSSLQRYLATMPGVLEWAWGAIWPAMIASVTCEVRKQAINFPNWPTRIQWISSTLPASRSSVSPIGPSSSSRSPRANWARGSCPSCST